jgi:hypothetical protein
MVQNEMTGPQWSGLAFVDSLIGLRLSSSTCILAQKASIPISFGRRVEVRAGQQVITVTALDSGELAARHERSYAKHRKSKITALEHARTLRQRRGQQADVEPLLQQRSLSVYDQLIA